MMHGKISMKFSKAVLTLSVESALIHFSWSNMFLSIKLDHHCSFLHLYALLEVAMAGFFMLGVAMVGFLCLELQ